MTHPPEVTLHAFNQWSYCPHRFWLMYVCNTMERNAHVYRGLRHHRRADRTHETTATQARQRRSIRVRHQQLGLVGVLDMMEQQPDGSWAPVETKAGRCLPQGQPWPNDALQLAAQAVCIEDSFDTQVHSGWIYYAGSRRRVGVPINSVLRNQVAEACTHMRRILTHQNRTAARYSGRCEGCSLVDVCLPKAADHILKELEQWDALI